MSDLDPESRATTFDLRPAPGHVDLERVGWAEHRRGALATGAVLVAWVALAAWRPTVTYHLAPMLAAGLWPYLLRTGPLRVSWQDSVRAGLAAAVLTIAVGLALTAAGWLRGPTLWGSGHAFVEVPPFALAGAFVGVRRARCGVGPLPDEPGSGAS
jgi:hypothetical protein